MAQSNKVLIVEDEEILADNLMIQIQRCGWQGCIAPTGRSAIQAANDFNPRLILLDYHLPDIDGFQALAAIRAARNDFVCVLMTAHPTDTVMADAQRYGIWRLLCKPFALAEVASCLSEVEDNMAFPVDRVAQCDLRCQRCFPAAGTNASPRLPEGGKRSSQEIQDCRRK